MELTADQAIFVMWAGTFAIGLLIAGAGLYWAIRTGQFSDPDRASRLPLGEDFEKSERPGSDNTQAEEHPDVSA